ncbi:MAG: hypothetical protein J5773_02980 [Verrucomicrobia bacterium]|nr:hypothetical protein [Verrucomicrobiota bacterium]MBR6461301.1 hypothetical protein [Verrucomicrobiota bacterium]
MMEINPLFIRYDKGWPLRNFLIFGLIFSIALMPFTVFYFVNTIPFKIIFQIGANGDLPYIRFFNFDISPSDYISHFLLLIIITVLYYALVGAFMGFISNALLCIYKKVKIKVNKEDDNFDYLDFSKKITKAEILLFLDFGVILTIIAIAVPSYFLWDIEIEFGNVSDLMWKLTH